MHLWMIGTAMRRQKTRWRSREGSSTLPAAEVPIMGKVNSGLRRGNSISQMHMAGHWVELHPLPTNNEKQVRIQHQTGKYYRTGAKNEIKQLPIDQPNVGLGCRMAPDGNQKHESAFCLEQCKRIQGRVITASLTFEEAYQYLLTRVVPAVCYAAAVTDIPQKLCRKMNTYIDLVMLPKIGLNRQTLKQWCMDR